MSRIIMDPPIHQECPFSFLRCQESRVGAVVVGHVQGHLHDGRHHHVLPLSPPIKTSPALFIMFAKTDYLSGSVQPPPSLPWTSSWTSSTRSQPTSLSPKCSLVSFVLSSLHQQMACTVQGSLRPGSRKTHY